MRFLTPFAILALLVAAAPTISADGEVVGSGSIILGGPHVSLVSAGELGMPGIDSFFLAAPAAGSVIGTQTVDNSGAGFDIDLFFFDAAGAYLGACANEGEEETGCVVPVGAAEVEVAAWFGAMLDVTVTVG